MFRGKKFLSVPEVAELVGVTRLTVYRWLRGLQYAKCGPGACLAVENSTSRAFRRLHHGRSPVQLWGRGPGSRGGRWPALHGALREGRAAVLNEPPMAEIPPRLPGDHYRLIVENSPVMIWRSAPDGKCDYFNDVWLAFTGRPLEKEVGDGWVEGVHPEDVSRIVACYLEHFERREPFEMEYRLRRHDGVYRYIFDRGVPYGDDAGRFAGFIGSCVDVDDRRRADAERERVEEQARQHQAELAHVLRIATIEGLAAGLAHELNQSLASIANDLEACATYVRSVSPGPDKVVTLLERATGEALRGGQIVHRLREFVQRGESRRETIDLREVVRNANRWFRREVEREQIAIRLELGREALPVTVDRIQMEQVFVNLLQNAVDTIREARSERKEVRVRTSRTTGGMAEVAVHDTGAGVSEAAVERLFEPFFTTKAHGLGMGLAICRSIVEAHHGRLAVEPGGPGAGTTVRLELSISGRARRLRSAPPRRSTSVI